MARTRFQERAAMNGAGQPGRVRLRTLTFIRWVGVVGQAVAILVVHYGLGFHLPLAPSLLVVGVSAVVNLGVTVIMLERPAAVRLGERAASWFLAYDILQLALLLYLTGGLQNPFAVLLLAPVSVSATILGALSTVALCVLSVSAITVLAVWHLPLPWLESGFALPFVYVVGIWAALGLAIVFFATYAWRVAAEARRMSDALTETQLVLSRERQLSALGALAAAAAHELGSPLGTILVAAREIDADLPSDSPIRGDVELLISETVRCRDILARLAARPEGDAEAFRRLPVSAVVELAAAHHAGNGIEIRLVAGAAEGTDAAQPTILRSEEILHGLGNLVQNATQVAQQAVTVETRWSDSAVTVTIADDGPGFPPGMLERLGEPYVSGWRDGNPHMGLGIFIAQNLLRRTGGRVSFANRPEGGAEVAVRWNRAILEKAAGDEAALAAVEDGDP